MFSKQTIIDSSDKEAISFVQFSLFNLSIIFTNVSIKKYTICYRSNEQYYGVVFGPLMIKWDW